MRPARGPPVSDAARTATATNATSVERLETIKPETAHSVLAVKDRSDYNPNSAHQHWKQRKEGHRMRPPAVRLAPTFVHARMPIAASLMTTALAAALRPERLSAQLPWLAKQLPSLHAAPAPSVQKDRVEGRRRIPISAAAATTFNGTV